MQIQQMGLGGCQMINTLQIAVISMGVLLIVIDFMTYVYQKVTESIGLWWFLIGGVLILLGAAPGLNAWTAAVPKKAVPAALLAGAVFFLAAFYFSSLISQLLRKNQELAMHVSLLNQENESILHEVRKLRKHMQKQVQEQVQKQVQEQVIEQVQAQIQEQAQMQKQVAKV